MRIESRNLRTHAPRERTTALTGQRDMQPRLVKLPAMTKSATTQERRTSNAGQRAVAGSRGTLLMRPNGWGGVEEGRWFEALGSTHVGGVCARCGGIARAADLKLTPVKGGETKWMHRKGECE